MTTVLDNLNYWHGFLDSINFGLTSHFSLCSVSYATYQILINSKSFQL